MASCLAIALVHPVGLELISPVRIGLHVAHQSRERKRRNLPCISPPAEFTTTVLVQCVCNW